MFRNHTAFWASAAVLALFLVGHYVFGKDNAKTVMDALVIGAAVTIFITWFSSAISALRSGVKDGGSNILISIWSIWTVLIGYFIYVRVVSAMRAIVATHGVPPVDPEWLVQSPTGGIFSALIFLSGAYAIMVPINDATPLPGPNFVRWVVGVGVGMFVSGVLMTLAFLKVMQFGS